MAFFNLWDVASLSSQGTVSSATMMVFELKQVSSSDPHSAPSLRLLAGQSVGSWPLCRSYESCLLLLVVGLAGFGFDSLLFHPKDLVMSPCTALLPMPLDSRSGCGSVGMSQCHTACKMSLPLCPRSSGYLGLAAGQSQSHKRKLIFPWLVCHNSFYDSSRSCAWSHCGTEMLMKPNTQGLRRK